MDAMLDCLKKGGIEDTSALLALLYYYVVEKVPSPTDVRVSKQIMSRVQAKSGDEFILQQTANLYGYMREKKVSQSIFAVTVCIVVLTYSSSSSNTQAHC